MCILYRQSILLSVFVFVVQLLPLNGQSLDSLLLEQMEESTEFTSATFKATRILNGHSIERTNEGQLDFRISHRFGTINSGAYEFFGLDQAHIHLSLEYGIKDWIMVGIGRGTFEKTVNGFAKFSLIRQSRGIRNMPVSVSYMSGIGQQEIIIIFGFVFLAFHAKRLPEMGKSLGQAVRGLNGAMQ